MAYNIRKYTASDLQAFTHLLHESFHIQNKDQQDLVLWKFFDNYHQNKTVTYVALDEEEQIVGQYTNMPIDVYYRNQILKAMMCIDMTTAVPHRGKGIITQLAEHVYQDVTQFGYDLSIGFSNDNGVKVDKHAKGYGYNVVGKFARYYKMISYRKKVPYHLVATQVFDDNPARIGDAPFISLAKDTEYLTWRYCKKPNTQYAIYRIQSSESFLGYVVLRFIENRCYVYDIITNSVAHEHMKIILRGIENESLARGFRLLVYHVLDNMYWKQLFNRYKYFKKSTSDTNFYLTVKLHNTNLDQAAFLDKENWLIMNGDIL